jgi:hypothetical protein
LAEIACGNFSGHRASAANKKRGFCWLRWSVAPAARRRQFQRTSSIARRQKAWFLPAALERGACGASAAISADGRLDAGCLS